MSEGQIIRVVEYAPDKIEIPIKNVYRYMGLGATKPDGALEALTQKSISDFISAAGYKACYSVVPITVSDVGVDFGAFYAESKSLAKNLKDCGKAVLFVATAGAKTELQRKRAAVTSPSQALVLDAVGTAAVESFCDKLCDGWADEFEGCFLRPRFSPGYGDLSLNMQKPLLSFLDSSRKAGIVLTDSLLMIPQKSVSAIVGIGKAGCTMKNHDCTLCDKSDCEFRL